MSSDSTIPNLESKKAVSDLELISVLSDLETDSPISNTDENAVLPEAEVDSVLQYLSNSQVVDVDSSEKANVDSRESPLPEIAVNHNIQVHLKSEGEKLLLILPTESQVPNSEYGWSEIWQQVKFRLVGKERFFSANTALHLVAQDRLLDGRQLQELAETLSEAQIQMKSVSTCRRQTAISAASSGYSVEQLQPETSLFSEPKAAKPPLAEALYLNMTVRSGVEIRHPGTVIVLGDLNPGGIVVADGDILVWGRLRGIAHAGASGNQECLIMALQMEPTQLRIADAVARAPEKLPMQFYPEVAHITPQGIRITKAMDFSRSLFNKVNQEQ
ncbi:MAG: septum site-determining protein MinC [Rhizonema sp. NSF051]|nr:septum site-determining protein MinC [Rhizonema sp. NSF051]